MVAWGSIPGQAIEILQVTGCGQKKMVLEIGLFLVLPAFTVSWEEVQNQKRPSAHSTCRLQRQMLVTYFRNGALGGSPHGSLFMHVLFIIDTN